MTASSWNIIKKTVNVVIYNNPTIVSYIDGNVIWDSELNKINIATSQQMEQKADIKNTYSSLTSITTTQTVLNKIMTSIQAGINKGTFYTATAYSTDVIESGYVRFASDISYTGTITVELLGLSGKNYKRRLDYSTSTWIETKWIEDATTDKIDILFPYNNGCEAVYPEDENKIYKNSLNIVSIFATVKKSDDSVLPTVFATLPVGYRPTKNITTMGRVILATDNTIHTIPVIVFANGNIETRNIYSVVKQLSFSITYYTV